MRRSPATRPQLNGSREPNFVNEILDALDTMAGVSPLSEADLKMDTDLMERAAARQEREPPADALQKPSVTVFFSLLFLIPSLLILAAVMNGFRPLGL